MRTKIIFIAVLTLALAALWKRETQLGQKLKELTIAIHQAEAERSAPIAPMAQAEPVEAKPRAIEVKPDSPAPVRTDAALQQTISRVKTLETQLRNLATANSQAVAARPNVPEYDPTQPPPPELLSAVPTNTPMKRSWGPEQATGPPDTERAGDIQTAWASREPDGAVEWLWLGFEQLVELSQVRVRETFNPGAISKIAAVVNGQEFPLWEGTGARGVAPRDFVVHAPPRVYSQAVIVYLDTSRAPGWNEIDAVEIVGRDGSRQWASQANASSTFAEGNTNRSLQTLELNLDSHRLSESVRRP